MQSHVDSFWEFVSSSGGQHAGDQIGATLNYQLVAESEADLKSGKISVNSPIGKGLLGKSVGDFAEISVPNGKIKFKILSITR